MRARPLAALVLALAACHAPATESTSSSSSTTTSSSTTLGDEGTTAASGSITGSTGGTAGSASSTTSGGEATSDASTRGEATGDASTSEDGTSTGATTGEAKSCKKLDILIQIIDGGYILDTTWALHELMPHVGQRLETEFADWDYHVMVLNPDGHWGDQYCEAQCQEGVVCEWDVPYPCDYDPDECDQTRGAGVVFPAGGEAANVRCPIDGDQRYLIRGQHDLPGALSCIGRVGVGYNPDHKLFPVARNVLDAVDAPLNAPGACNEGFFREDAYLIVFVVAAFPDILSEGTPEEWTAELKSHKGGKFDKIYFVGLFNGCDSGIEHWEYDPLFEWAESFYYHQTYAACAATVIPFMDPALDYVLGDCQE